MCLICKHFVDLSNISSIHVRTSSIKCRNEPQLKSILFYYHIKSHIFIVQYMLLCYAYACGLYTVQYPSLCLRSVCVCVCVCVCVSVCVCVCVFICVCAHVHLSLLLSLILSLSLSLTLSLSLSLTSLLSLHLPYYADR